MTAIGARNRRKATMKIQIFKNTTKVVKLAIRIQSLNCGFRIESGFFLGPKIWLDLDCHP